MTTAPATTTTRVTTPAQLRAFLDLPRRLHPRDRYVPIPHPQIRAWHRTGAAELHLAHDPTGRVTGRICLHRSPAFDAKRGARHQLFGLTEFTDAATAGRLFALAEQHAADTDRLFGPVSLLPNETGGVITSGHQHRGFIDSAWNPAHYPAAYAAHGFQPAHPSDTWICDRIQQTDPDAAYPFDDTRLTTEGLRIHHGTRRRLPEQLPLLRTMLNASFAQLGYYTELSAAQLAAQTDGLTHLMDERLLLYLTKDDTPIAFILALPDISPFLMRTGGRLGPADQLHLLATRRRYRREAVLIVKGTVPEHQGRGYLTLLSRELHRGLRAGGYDTLRSTFVEHTNPASAASYRRIGGRPLHGYAFYEKRLEP
ncbi:GNAT family N-acetyltransferase [Streptomyces boninensis]|uniref:GNAT family N-acetyltransferase n=1 Tax=Streptomyces boninensis TaxID=2039455 RepID=UPI003B21DA88